MPLLPSFRYPLPAGSGSSHRDNWIKSALLYQAFSQAKRHRGFIRPVSRRQPGAAATHHFRRRLK